MGALHVKVCDIEENLEFAKQRLVTDNADTQRELDNTTREVDGVPNVYYKLADFCDELRKHFKGIRFGYRRGHNDSEAVGITTRLHSLWAYYPGQEYALGKVGFMSLGKHGGRKFTVYARTITNNKFREGRDEYYTAVTEDFDKEVKNAKKYLRPYSTAEIFSQHGPRIASAATNIRNKVNAAFNEAQSELVCHESFTREMQRLVDGSHEFVDATFKSAVVTYLDALKEKEQRMYAGVAGKFIYIREEAGEQVCDVIHSSDVHRMTFNNKNAVVTTIKFDELDEDTAHKIASLSILEDDGFVDGLGMKVNDKMYWVSV